MDKIGVGIVTCNRPKFFLKCFRSIPDDFLLAVVNDGADFEDIDKLSKEKSFTYFHNHTNLGVGKSKNILFRYLLDSGCDHIFIIEDDIIVKDPSVFRKYIEASKKSGIEHFLFGYHGPANRGNVSKGVPTPRFIIDYKDFKIAFNANCVGAFCYYTKNCLQKIGLIDEEFLNAFEHVEHSYRLAKAGFCTPYYYWPDLANSCDLLEEAECSELSSAIRPRDDWMDNIKRGALLFKNKHKYSPAWDNAVPDTPHQEVLNMLKKLKK